MTRASYELLGSSFSWRLRWLEPSPRGDTERFGNARHHEPIGGSLAGSPARNGGFVCVQAPRNCGLIQAKTMRRLQE